MKYYGDSESYELREQSRSEPLWKDAGGDLPDFTTCHTVITKTSVGEYYGSL